MRSQPTLRDSLLCSLIALAGCASEAHDDATPDDAAAVCGNGLLEDGELCDGAALDGTSCESLGYASGELYCRLDCQGLRTHACGPTPASFEITAAHLARPIPDDAYDGTLASMACVDVTVGGAPKFGMSFQLTTQLGIDHPWVGDLVVKVVAPSGRTRTYVHRPGRVDALDDGAGEGGVGADLSAAFPIELSTGGASAEAMGAGLGDDGVVCRDDDVCRFHAAGSPTPNVDAPEVFTGTWTVCVGDAGAGDVGTLDSVVLSGYLLAAGPVPVSTRATLDLPIPDGAYDGSVASMVCAPMPIGGDDDAVAEVEVDLAIDHPRASQLVWALVDPDGRAYALASRPTVDEDATGAATVAGGFASLSATATLRLHIGSIDPLPSAETLGADTGGSACPGLGCDYAAEPGGSALGRPEEVIGRGTAGVWQVCVGDAVPGQKGTVVSAGLVLVPSL